MSLKEEIKKSNKTAAFLCSNPEINDLARKFQFDVLSAKNENLQIKPLKIKPISPGLTIAVPIISKGEDEDLNDEDLDMEHESGEDENKELDDFSGEDKLEDERDVASEKLAEEDSKDEEKEPEEIENEPLYGTELDDEGNIIYDKDEENAAEQIASVSDDTDNFRVITASTKTHRRADMNDVVQPGAGRNIKIIQKDQKPIKVEMRKEKEDDIQSVWGSSPSDNIWNDIPKPYVLKWPFLDKFRLFKKEKRSIKNNLKYNPTNFLKRRAGLLAVVSILALSFFIYLRTGSAKLEIRPRPQELNTQLKVTMSPNFSSIDDSFNRIPGQLFIVNKSASDVFNATAEKDAIQKSRGTITIYNEYSTSPQPLIATTRFEYIQTGKDPVFVFRTLQTIIVPGMKIENGVVTPGKINVEVVADKAGQTYNVPAGDFGIVTWREKGDTARYEKIYGKSSESMHGGILGKAKVISEFDYNNAKDQLVDKVKDEINEALRSQSVGLELMNAIESKVDSIESTGGIDDAADTFTVTVNGSITTVGFKKDDLLSLVSRYVDRTNGLMVVPERIELAYKNVVINPTNNTLEVVVTIGGNAYAKIDKADITAKLMGKSESQIKDYLGSIKEIDSAKVVLSPFWVKKIPKDESKIDILLTY